MRFIFFILIWGEALALDLYVDKDNGKDSNTGHTIQEAFASIHKAAKVAKAGDTVHIKRASSPYGPVSGYSHPTYNGQDEPRDVLFLNDGTPQAPITFTSYAPYTPKPRHVDRAQIGDLRFEIRRSNIVISYLDFKDVNTGIEVIHVMGNWLDPSFPQTNVLISETRNIQVKNCRFSRTDGPAILVEGAKWKTDPWHDNPTTGAREFHSVHGILFKNNILNQVNTNGYNEQITAMNGVTNVIIARNYITDGGSPSGGEGVDLKEGVRDAWVYDNHCIDNRRTCFYVDGGRGRIYYQNPPGTERVPATKNIHFYRNLIRYTKDATVVGQTEPDGSGISIASEGTGDVEDVFVKNNIIDGSRDTGLLLYLHDDGRTANPPGDARNIYFINNTVVQGPNSLSVKTGTRIRIDWPGASNVHVRNNIAYTHDGTGTFSTAGSYSNVFFSNNISNIPFSVSAQNTNNQIADPLFEDLPNHDLRLSHLSPAIGFADRLFSPPFDFFGKRRDATPDAGAIEFLDATLGFRGLTKKLGL